MSENQYPPTKPVCQLDADNLYLHQTVADLDPLAADGGYLLPAGCVDTQPPETRAGFAARWLPERAEWQYLPDHRGVRQTVRQYKLNRWASYPPS